MIWSRGESLNGRQRPNFRADQSKLRSPEGNDTLASLFPLLSPIFNNEAVNHCRSLIENLEEGSCWDERCILMDSCILMVSLQNGAWEIVADTICDWEACGMTGRHCRKSPELWDICERKIEDKYQIIMWRFPRTIYYFHECPWGYSRLLQNSIDVVQGPHPKWSRWSVTLAQPKQSVL